MSITLGRPLAIHLQDTDVSLPDPSLDATVNHCESDTDQLAPTFCRTALFVHIVRYRIICGDILSALHNGSTRTQTDEAPALAARDRLANELATWRRDTANLSLSDVDLSSTLPGDRSSFRTREWYEMLYHNALLMLYRPSPGLSSASSRDAVVLQTIFNRSQASNNTLCSSPPVSANQLHMDHTALGLHGWSLICIRSGSTFPLP